MYKLNYYCYYYHIVCMLTSVWESAQNIYCVVFTPWVPEMNSFYVCLLKIHVGGWCYKLGVYTYWEVTINYFFNRVFIFQPEVIELHLHLTPSMLAIQTAALDLIDSCLKELKRANPTVSFIWNNYVVFCWNPLYTLICRKYCTL